MKRLNVNTKSQSICARVCFQLSRCNLGFPVVQAPDCSRLIFVRVFTLDSRAVQMVPSPALFRFEKKATERLNADLFCAASVQCH